MRVYPKHCLLLTYGQLTHPSCGRFTKKKQKKLLVGAWNVRTLLDRDNTARPERRTALIEKELAHYRIDIAALSETRLADEIVLKEDGCGYTFFWRGKTEAEDRLHGVGFGIRSSLIKSIPSLPVGINERLMKLRLPLTKSRHLTIISAYAPTLTNSEETKRKFYEDLDQLIRPTSSSDKLLIMGGFNAKVGKDQASWKRILGSQGVGKMNSNGWKNSIATVWLTVSLGKTEVLYLTLLLHSQQASNLYR